MNKISSIVRTQAHLQFQQQRKEKLKAILSKKSFPIKVINTVKENVDEFIKKIKGK